MLSTKIQQLLKFTLMFLVITAFMSFSTPPLSENIKEENGLCAVYATKSSKDWDINKRSDWETCIKESPLFQHQCFIQEGLFKVEWKKNSSFLKIVHPTLRTKGCWKVKLIKSGNKLGFTKTELSQAKNCNPVYSSKNKRQNLLCAKYASKNGKNWKVSNKGKGKWDNCIRNSPSLGKKCFIQNNNFKVVAIKNQPFFVKIINSNSRKNDCWKVKLKKHRNELFFTEEGFSEAVDCNK